MYNTIEVIKMDITNARFKFFKKDGFGSTYKENVRHIKILPYLSIVQPIEGSYDIALGNGDMLHTEEGGFFIAPSNIQQTIVHHVNKDSEKMSARWIFVDVEINKSFSLDTQYQFPLVINDNLKNEMNILFDHIFETDDIWQNYSDCFALIGQLLKIATPIPNTAHKGVQEAVTYINENYRSGITIKTLANMANMSESNFYAVFKKQMGISPIAYLNNYRLSIAIDKLIDTSDTIKEISLSVGVTDPLYFCRLFKKTYGMTPREYRYLYQTRCDSQQMTQD